MTYQERLAAALAYALRTTGDEDLADAVQDISENEASDPTITDEDFMAAVRRYTLAYAAASY